MRTVAVVLWASERSSERTCTHRHCLNYCAMSATLIPGGWSHSRENPGARVQRRRRLSLSGLGCCAWHRLRLAGLWCGLPVTPSFLGIGARMSAWRWGPDPEGRFLLPRARWSDFAFTH